MEKKEKTSITDLPKKAENNDDFGIKPFEKGLIRFIEGTDAPITIALQGEWGSGKTSLMNSLKNNLCDEKGKRFYPVWLNTWQFSLMKSDEDTILAILNGLTNEIAEIATRKNSALKNLADKSINILSKVAAASVKVAVKATTGQNAGDEVDAVFTKDARDTTILKLRDSLNELINKVVESTDKDGFLFFIDDLDRIDPPVAVNILELLKNIFDLDKCVFILAIDYDVVVKGLKPKYGELTDKNEREFRSFFDKIIQVPFKMPVDEYIIDDFLKDSLVKIKYLEKEDGENNDLIREFSTIAKLTVGTNPRALKRLLNTLSLISCINEAKKQDIESDPLNDKFELLVNFYLVSIQIAYKRIYELLNSEPEFDKWDETVALKMNLKELDSDTNTKLKTIPEFDEPWELVLFRLCESDHYLKKKGLEISKLLNNLKEHIGEKKSIKDVIKKIISLSAVTNVGAVNKIAADYNRNKFLKDIRWKLNEQNKQDLPEIKDTIRAYGKVQKFARFTLSDTLEESYPAFWMQTYNHEGKIRLQFDLSAWMSPTRKGSLKECLEEADELKEFEEIEEEYNFYFAEKTDYSAHNLYSHITKNDKSFVVRLHINLDLKNENMFYDDETIKIMSSVVIRIREFMMRMKVISDRVYGFYKKLDKD